MPEQHLFEYAVIRVMPKVEREEFLNAGIILFCKKLNFLHVLFEVNKERLIALYPQFEIEEVTAHLKALRAIAAGEKAAGPIAELGTPDRFRWLTAQRSTVLQTSKVHPGLCYEPMKMVKQLFEEMVL